jgi:hypothetical protein
MTLTQKFFHESSPWDRFDFFEYLRRYSQMNVTGVNNTDDQLFMGVNDTGD